jgi:phage baseplate assembly protein gpV
MNESVFNGLVRIGFVTDKDSSARKVRVKFRDVDMTSGWLPVLQHFGASISVSSAGDPAHKHTATLGYWMPGVNDTVAVLYLPVFNGDGYVLGGI